MKKSILSKLLRILRLNKKPSVFSLCFRDTLGFVLSYFYLKPPCASWANGGVLTLLPWETKGAFAGGAISVNVGFTVSAFAFLQSKIRLWLLHNFKEFFVFSASFVNIS